MALSHVCTAGCSIVKYFCEGPAFHDVFTVLEHGGFSKLMVLNLLGYKMHMGISCGVWTWELQADF